MSISLDRQIPADMEEVGTMRILQRGAVHDALLDDTPRRVVVISIDEHNERPYTGTVLVAPLSRRPKPFAVSCADTDRVCGFIHVAEMAPIPLRQLGGWVCLISGPTIARLDDAIRAYTDLPR